MSIFDSVSTSDWFSKLKQVTDAISSTNEQTKMSDAPKQQDAVLNGVPVDQQVNANTADAQLLGKSFAVNIGGNQIPAIYLIGGVIGLAAVVMIVNK